MANLYNKRTHQLLIQHNYKLEQDVHPVKCVIWDLDDTLWQGVLAEGDTLVLTDLVKRTILEFDARGILQSIASRNNHCAAWQQLKAFGLDQYFLHPQINWGNKSESLQIIIDALGIGADSVVMIDDQPFERDEVKFRFPEVRVVDAARICDLLDSPDFRPICDTTESRQRRRIYQADIQRQQDEHAFGGPRQDFLAMLGMSMLIRHATGDDLQRAEELTHRTNQLNATGTIFSRSELEALLLSDDHDLLVAELQDRYGPSGVIGFSLIQREASDWLIRMLLMSCRVLSRGTGGIFLSHILQRAAHHKVCLRAEFVPTDRNRIMYLTYKFCGFVEDGERDGVILLKHELEKIRPFPPYVDVYVAYD